MKIMYLWWICFGIILIILELLVMTFDLAMIGFAALLTGALVYYFDLPLLHASILFLTIACITLFVGKGIIKKPVAQEAGSPVIGTQSIIVKNNGENFIILNGIFWKVADSSLSDGDIVTITGMTDNILHVQKIG